MNLADDRLKGLDNASFTPDDCARLRCRVAADFIDTGQFEVARESLGELWQGLGSRPPVEELGVGTASEVLLQVGTLTGWLGASRQAPGAQEAAKDLISESITLFESLGEPARVAAARSELSLCYWREGAYDEARILLKDALDELAETEARAKAFLRLSVVETSAGRYTDSLSILEDNAFIFDNLLSHALRGSFHNQLALVLKQMGALEGRPDYLDRAIIEYTAAIYHQEQAGHERYRATNENNLACLLFKMGRHKEAHLQLDRAGATLLRLKDSGRLAQIDDTRARVFIAEKRYREAEAVIGRAVKTLEAGGAAAPLAEALTTQGVAWARLGKNDESIKTLRRAIELAEGAGVSSDAGLAALTLIEEHGARRALSPEELYDLYRRADKYLKVAQRAESATRLRACARLVMRRMAGVQLGDKNFTIFNAVHELEAKLIGQALEQADGSVTRAAQLLGVRHQTFLAMLNNRHRKLLAKRNPLEKRLRSIIKKTEE